MSGPFIPGRAAQPLDLLEAGVAGGGWESLEAMFKPHLQRAPLQPADDVARALYVMYALGGEGRAVIEWLMDITIRAPFRVTGSTIEETALHAAGRQCINGVGEAVLTAIAHGETIFKSQNPNGAGA
jgi:hypothetical protein